jgi:hypothetical protein
MLDEADDPHGPLTVEARARVNFIDLSNQPGPILPIRLWILIWFQNPRYQTILVLLLTPSRGKRRIMP